MPDRTDRYKPFSTIFPELLTTKLYRPPVSADLEPRVDLIARLERNLHRAVTLISAPTGYGKSTLASLWLDASEAPGGWVSLDEEDDDPRLFLAYVTAAIRSAFPDIELDVQTFFEVSVFPAPPVVARTLLNDLERIPQRMLLALDDLQVIRSRAVYDLLAELLRHPSPKLHLVLISRRDVPLPLSSMRAYRQITEIRAQDLRFSSTDTASLLTRTLNRQIDDATAAAWTERTEGWAAALSLAAISQRQRGRGDLKLEELPVDTYYLQQYLMAEVIDHLDPILIEWLMAMAWVDRFCAELCTAVCQAGSVAADADLTGEAFIQQLWRDNLFVIPLDSQHRWFRFHDLFRTLLQSLGRQRHTGDEIVMFQRRAGAWLARQALPDEAIRYLAAAGDYAAAEQLVQRLRYTLMNTLQWSRLDRWLNYFPRDLLERSALLMSTNAVVTLHRGQYAKAAAAAQRARELLANPASQSSIYNALVGEVSTVEIVLAVASGDAQVAVTKAQRSAQLLPADALLLRSIACGGIVASKQMSGQFADGCLFLKATLDEPQWTRPLRIRLMHYLCIVSYMQGDLATTEEWAGRIHQISVDHNLSVPLSMARYFLGVIHYLRQNFDIAEPYLRALLQDHAVATPSYLNTGAFILALIHNSRGEFARADTLLDQVSTYFKDARNAFALNALRAFTVDLAWRRGDLEAARRQRIGVDFDNRFPLWLFYIPQLTPIKLLLAEGTPEALGEARTALDEFVQRTATIHLNGAHIDGLALLALVCEAQGDSACADTSLCRALILAQGAGIVRPFVDLGPPMAELLQRLRNQADGLSAGTAAFVDQLLAAFPTSKSVAAALALPSEPAVQTSSAVSRLPEPLTPRELQVLQQLTTHLTPAEIAARHVVSVATVRWQIKSIYRKLDVHSRKEAVRRSRELNLV